MITNIKFITFLCLPAFQTSFSQERIITGKVIAEDLTALPWVIIESNSKVVDTTDMNGNFKFKFAPEIKSLEFVFTGMETEKVEIKEDCDTIELIMLEKSTYDFVSLKSAERKMKRKRKSKLPKLYAEAYRKKVFKNIQSCR
ncbi:hypothetical protein GCM10011508_04090 [Flavobacterium lutivivi]|nr:hypothetical protein GCM10011508_04090 [Flavobacterium lutivivi]